VDGYSLRQLLVFYDESIPIVDEKGEIGGRKKQYTQKRK
jgi:hypothetical protein